MDRKQGTAIWILVGCLGLFFVLVCGGVGAWVLFLAPVEDETDPLAGPTGPIGPTAPTGPGGPTAPTAPPGPTGPGAPRRVVATVSSVNGSAPVGVGTRCEFDVERRERDDGTFWCNAQVTCGGQLLYGGPTAGFFDCILYDQPIRHVVGGEDNTTSQDSDAAMRLDTLQGRLTVRDDAAGRYGAYSLTADVQSVR